MLEKMYYYGLTPSEVRLMTFAEMASFSKAQRKRNIDDAKMNAGIAYNAGIVASMAMSKKRPKFNELYKFPEEEPTLSDIETSRKQMLVWAEQANRIARRKK